MSTTENTAKSCPAGELRFDESVDAYMNRLLEGHTRFSDMLEKARARNARIADKIVGALLAGQRETLELGRAVAAHPTEYGKNTEAFLQSLTHAQERALELAKVAYEEQTEAAGEARKLVEPLLESGKTLSKPFERFAAVWSAPAK